MACEGMLVYQTMQMRHSYWEGIQVQNKDVALSGQLYFS